MASRPVYFSEDLIVEGGWWKKETPPKLPFVAWPFPEDNDSFYFNPIKRDFKVAQSVPSCLKRVAENGATSHFIPYAIRIDDPSCSFIVLFFSFTPFFVVWERSNLVNWGNPRKDIFSHLLTGSEGGGGGWSVTSVLWKFIVGVEMLRWRCISQWPVTGHLNRIDGDVSIELHEPF